jgi:hypothetical protein
MHGLIEGKRVTTSTTPAGVDGQAVGEFPELSFDCTVPRQLVHKHAVEAVYVTDSVALSDTEFVCAAFLPRANSPTTRALTQRFSRYDLAMLIELGRQAAFVVTHRHLDVPANFSTLLSSIGLEVLDTSVTGRMTIPSKVLLKVRAVSRSNKRGRVVAGDFVLDVYEGDRLIARMTAAGSVAAPEKYKIARSMTRDALVAKGWDTPDPLPLVAPELVGRDAGAGTLVSALTVNGDPRAFKGQMFVDSDDLFFFDHPIDHVPGIVSIEAIRQAAVLAACALHPELRPEDALVRAFAGEFSGFGEADLPLAVEVTVGEAVVTGDQTVLPMTAAITQVGESVVTATLSLEFTPA